MAFHLLVLLVILKGVIVLYCIVLYSILCGRLVLIWSSLVAKNANGYIDGWTNE